jgi:hypothetical protein
MPFFFRRPRRLSVDILPVPHEPSAAERARPARYTERDVVDLVDWHLTVQSERLPDDRNTELIDALLTIRNALTVPVNPGRIP